MDYPSFIAEMGLESNRPQLRAGVASGYALAAAFELLAIVGYLVDAVPWTWAFHLLVLVKLVTNTAMLVTLRVGRNELEAAGANTVADVIVMTGAIYYTGGQASPLLVIYFILITVLAMLTNRGVTLLVAGLVIAMFTAMVVLTQLGVLTQQPSPLEVADLSSTRLVVVAFVYQCAALAVPTLFVTRIVGALKRREAALEARTGELLDAGVQKSQFMANITHELRTPIHGIMSVTELLAEEVYGPVPERQQLAHAAIAETAGSLLRLVDDLLWLAKAEAGRVEIHASDVDVSEVLEAAASAVRWMAETKSLTVENEVADDLPRLRTDRAKLAQIVVNLMGNAAKFTPDGGRITLGARSAGASVELWVSDTGIGIPEDQLEHIFEAFRQVDGSDERRYGGVGLGLSLVSRLSQLLGGEVRVRSAVGEGSTFTVVLSDLPAA